MKDLRIIFMGTPDFAVATLEKLLEQGHTVVGVITAPDRPAGRGRKLQQSAVKRYALQKGLPVLQPTNLKNRDFLSELAELRANLQIVVAFRMLPKVVWTMPEYGTFNLHASLLPNYRGAAPINWVLINGETETGVTTFFIDDNIDTGEIILQERTPIDEHETAGSLHDRLMVMGANLVEKTVRQIANGSVTTTVQPTVKGLKTAYKIHRETCKIDWSLSLEAIYDHIRGLSPYPTAWSTLVSGDTQLTVKLYLVAKERAMHQYQAGHLVWGKNELKVAVSDGFLKILEMQLPGKRRMKTGDILNGLKLEKTAFLV